MKRQSIPALLLYKRTEKREDKKQLVSRKSPSKLPGQYTSKLRLFYKCISTLQFHRRKKNKSFDGFPPLSVCLSLSLFSRFPFRLSFLLLPSVVHPAAGAEKKYKGNCWLHFTDEGKEDTGGGGRRRRKEFLQPLLHLLSLLPSARHRSSTTVVLFCCCSERHFGTKPRRWERGKQTGARRKEEQN